MRLDAAQATLHLQGAIERYPLLDAILNRRSRRFGRHTRLNGGPLAFASAASAQSLSAEEEALLAFAACGITGYALGDLPYDDGEAPGAGGGNIMINYVARTVPSGDAAHTIAVFVINDEGAWMLKRPQDYSRAAIAARIQSARDHKFSTLYETGRIRVSDRRVDVPREAPYTTSFNKWSANAPGSTVFLPVAELTALTINVILAAFSEEAGYYVLDERNGYRPAGVRMFARSKGGHLDDDPSHGRVATIGLGEIWALEFAAIEQGAILQNLGLMSEAIGLGGFPYFAAHPFGWMQALGFRMVDLPFSQMVGASPVMKGALRLLRRDLPIPTAVGLDHDGQPLIKPFCPPYYRSMREAVLAFVDYKTAEGHGTQHDGGVATGWKDAPAVQRGIPRPSDKTVDATIAYCEYVYGRYGRFPSSNGPFRTVLAFQAHHLDLDFYDRFYRPDVVTDQHRQHSEFWHQSPEHNIAM